MRLMLADGSASKTAIRGGSYNSLPTCSVLQAASMRPLTWSTSTSTATLLAALACALSSCCSVWRTSCCSVSRAPCSSNGRHCLQVRTDAWSPPCTCGSLLGPFSLEPFHPFVNKTIPEHTSRCTTSCTDAGILCSALELSSSKATSTSSAARYSFISNSDRYLQQEHNTVQDTRLNSTPRIWWQDGQKFRPDSLYGRSIGCRGRTGSVCEALLYRGEGPHTYQCFRQHERCTLH